MKLLRKGIAKDRSFIRLTFQCRNGIDTYNEDFTIYNQCDLFTGYGCYERKPDFHITIKDTKYACYWCDAYGCNRCYIEK